MTREKEDFHMTREKEDFHMTRSHTLQLRSGAPEIALSRSSAAQSLSVRR